MLRAYLRTRLHKLEACCAAVLADQSMQTRLSQRELQYAQVCFGTHSILTFSADFLRAPIFSQLPSPGAVLMVCIMVLICQKLTVSTSQSAVKDYISMLTSKLRCMCGDCSRRLARTCATTS